MFRHQSLNPKNLWESIKSKASHHFPLLYFARCTHMKAQERYQIQVFQALPSSMHIWCVFTTCMRWDIGIRLSIWRILSMSSTFAPNCGMYAAQLYCHSASPIVGQNIVQRCTTHEGTGTLTPRPMSPYCCSEPTLQNYKESSCKRKTAVRYAYVRDRCKRDSHANFEHRDNAAAFTANWGWVSWWRICPCVGWCGIVLASQRQVSFGSCRDFWALRFDARRQSLRLFGQGQMELMGGVCD